VEWGDINIFFEVVESADEYEEGDCIDNIMSSIGKIIDLLIGLLMERGYWSVFRCGSDCFFLPREIDFVLSSIQEMAS